MKQKILLSMFALSLCLTLSSEQIFALGINSSTAQELTPPPTPETAVQMAERINTYRTEQGLPAYYQDQTLAQASQWVVDTMAATEFISHYDESGANPQQRAEKAGYNEHVTEIIFGGFGGAEAAWKWWTENELYLNLLTSEDYVEFGVATTYNEQSGRQYWAVMFGFGDGQYEANTLTGHNNAASTMTKLPPTKSISTVTAVPAASTATNEPDPTATTEIASLAVESDDPQPPAADSEVNYEEKALEANRLQSSTLEESRWLIIAAVATIIMGIAVFYFPHLGISQKFKERT